MVTCVENSLPRVIKHNRQSNQNYYNIFDWLVSPKSLGSRELGTTIKVHPIKNLHVHQFRALTPHKFGEGLHLIPHRIKNEELHLIPHRIKNEVPHPHI